MKKRSSSLGVDWHLPDGKGGFKNRRFATTTMADAYALEILASDGFTFNQARSYFIYSSPEQDAVLDGFIQAGYGDHRMDMFIRVR